MFGEAAPEGYGEAVEVASLMMLGLVRQFSWAEWQELPAEFTRQLRTAWPVLHEVRSYKGSLG